MNFFCILRTREPETMELAMRLFQPINATVNRALLALVLYASSQLLAIPGLTCFAGGGGTTTGGHPSANGTTTEISLGQQSETVDLIELNHFIDDEGREVFRQLVFYDWSDLDKRFHVRAWRLIKNDRQLPRRFWKPKRYECHWHDSGVRKTVSAKQLRETWTQQDPERVNRKLLPEDQRIPLFEK